MNASATCDDDGPCGFHAENRDKADEPCGRGWEPLEDRVRRQVAFHEDALRKLRVRWGDIL